LTSKVSKSSENIKPPLRPGVVVVGGRVNVVPVPAVVDCVVPVPVVVVVVVVVVLVVVDTVVVGHGGNTENPQKRHNELPPAPQPKPPLAHVGS
jgi:hypothetical protein